MARKKNENDYALQTIISKDAAEFLSNLAKEDDRSLVKYTKRIIMEHLKANGYVEKATSNVENKEEHINKEETQKKSNSSIDDNAKQSANCNSLSIGTSNKKKKGSNKVAPVPMSFISQ